MLKERTQPVENYNEQLTKELSLILYNDDHNTFDFVIDTLIEVCNHNVITAEQITMVVHYKGKCTVKNGDIEELEPLGQEMTNRGLTISIK